MTFTEAYNLAIDLLQDGFSIDRLLEKPGRCVTALEVLETEGGEQGEEIVMDVYDRIPGLLNYDNYGNWVGPVANENGWTA